MRLIINRQLIKTWQIFLRVFAAIKPGQVFVFILTMFILGYLESLRWPLLVGPKATHGILKGMFLLLLPYLIFRFAGNRRVLKRPEVIGTAVFVLSFCLSAVFSLEPDTSRLYLWYPLIVLAVITTLYGFRQTQDQVDRFILTAILLIYITFAFAFFSIIFRLDVEKLYYFIFMDHRAYHLLSEIREVGKYVSLGPYFMLTPLTAAFLISSSAPPIRRILSGLAVLLSVFVAVISNNRIDVAVIGLIVLVLLFLFPRKVSVLLLALFIPAVIFGLFVTESYFGYNLEERFFRPSKERDIEAAEMRLVYWGTALDNFRRFPIFGTGPNTYNDISDFPLRKYFNEGAKEGFYVRSDYGIGIHNLFIERLADTGAVGLFAFITMLWLFLKKDLTEFSKRKQEERKRYLLFALSSWMWILYGLTDNGYGVQGMVTFFIIRGMMASV
jgi:O-antigen ligase